MTRYAGIFTQHVDGISRQFAVIGNYGLTPTDVDNAWSNIYSGTLNSNKQLIASAKESGFGHFEGVALALEAYSMIVSSDLWGDMPYSDAFKFAENGVYLPTFDTQEQIYTQALANLTAAKALFAGESGGNALGGADLMFGGDVSKWTKFCNVLEARAMLHTSKIDGSAYSKVLTALGNGGFDSSADDAGFAFGEAATENAPWFQYIEQRDDCEVGAAYLALLESFNDPRVATYGQLHTNDHPIFTKSQTVKLLSYTEQEFMRAVALLGSDRDAAYAAYLGAISSSFDEALMTSAEYDTYIAGPSVGVGAANLTLENIINQKYLALYTSPEVFSDWRRTNFPALTPITGSTIPRRFPYPQSERLSNPDNTPSPANVTIFSRVWWDSM
jgi:hypothetical protein